MRISRTFSTFFNLVKRAGNYKFLLISQFVVIRTFLLGISRTRIKSAGNSNYAKLKFNYLAKFVQFEFSAFYVLHGKKYGKSRTFLVFICQFIPPFYDFRIVELNPLFKRWAEPRILNIIAITARFLNHSIMCKISDGSEYYNCINHLISYTWLIHFLH